MNRKQNEYVKYTFSGEERTALANRMAQKVTDLHQAEDEKKAIIPILNHKLTD